MEEVKDLKDVLEKVESKLIAADNIYGAINFAFWLMAMAGFYVILGVAGNARILSPLYWGIALFVGISLTGKIFKRMVRMYVKAQKNVEGSRKLGILILFPWIIGSLVGWVIIPSTSIAVSEEARLAVGFLSFISISIAGMWFVMTRGKSGKEMAPSFAVPALCIPIAWNMKSGAMLWAGFVVAFGFALTVLLYLYSAFKAIER